MTNLKCVAFNKDFPDGLTLNFPGTGSLWGIYVLLANGRNVSVELTKDNGDRIIYRLASTEADND